MSPEERFNRTAEAMQAIGKTNEGQVLLAELRELRAACLEALVSAPPEKVPHLQARAKLLAEIIERIEPIGTPR